mgnify:FL=1
MRTLNFALTAMAPGVGLGLVAASWSLSSAGSSPVLGNPGWREWQLATATDAAPYAAGFFLSSGTVPPASAHARSFFRNRDDEGNALTGDCVFVLSGRPAGLRWWSLALANEDGSLKPGHPVLAAPDVVTTADGDLVIRMARRAQPGNWLRPPGDGRYALYFTAGSPLEGMALQLPAIKREGC